MIVRVHAEHGGCWCKPERLHVFADGSVTWLHRYEDGTLPGIFYQVTDIVLHAFGDPGDPGDVILEWELEESSW